MAGQETYGITKQVMCKKTNKMKNNKITTTIRTLLTAAAMLIASATCPAGLRAQTTPVTYNYTYDANGNLTHDGRKGLEMRWNVLNLLDSAGVHGSSLKYSWLSDGTKVSASEDDGNGNVLKRHYVGSFVFVEDPESGEWAKESVAWDEGRIFFDVPFIVDSTVVDDPLVEDRGYRDCWYARDHLGNVRAVIDITPGMPAPQVVEQSDYLPFGTKILNPAHASMPSNRWRYAGKEEQDFGSLNLGLLDFGARMYDPFTARWTAVDPMAGKYGQTTPYSYCGGNPIGIIDDGGLDLIIAGKNNSSVTFKTDLIDKTFSVASLGIDWKGDYTLEGDAILSAGLDLVGIIDPSGVADFANAALQIRNGDYSGAGLSALGLIPYVGDIAKAGKVGKDVRIISDATALSRNIAKEGFTLFEELGIKDGMKASSSEILDYGEQFLGKGYREVSPGRYLSADGKRAVRIGDSDILGYHSGAPHANFETLVPNPQKPGKYKVELNYHIFITD